MDLNLIIVLLVGVAVVGVVVLAALAVSRLEGGSEPVQEGSDDVLQDLLKYARTDEERRQILRLAEEQGLSGAADLALTYAGPPPRHEPAPQPYDEPVLPAEDQDNIEEEPEGELFARDGDLLSADGGSFTEEEMEQTLILPPPAAASSEGE